jgi:hypothetical protein
MFVVACHIRLEHAILIFWSEKKRRRKEEGGKRVFFGSNPTV